MSQGQRPSPYTIPSPVMKFAEGPATEPISPHKLTIKLLIHNLTLFATFYETSSASIDNAEPIMKSQHHGYRDANSDIWQRQFQAALGIDRVRTYILANYGDELTIGTARRLLGELIQKCKLSIDAAESLLLDDAIDRLGQAEKSDLADPHTYNPGRILDAVRRLRRAIENPIPYEDRPGKTRISVTDEELKHIRDVFHNSVEQTPDALPLGVETKIRFLWDNLSNLCFREIENPNRLHRQALNTLREIEHALAAVSAQHATLKSDKPSRSARVIDSNGEWHTVSLDTTKFLGRSRYIFDRPEWMPSIVVPWVQSETPPMIREAHYEGMPYFFILNQDETKGYFLNEEQKDSLLMRPGATTSTTTSTPSTTPGSPSETSMTSPPSEVGKTTTSVDPFTELRQYAKAEFSGKQRAAIEAICDAAGELRLADLAVKEGVDWKDAKKSFETVQRAVRAKLKKLGWVLVRRNNAAVLSRLPASARKSPA